MLRRLCIQVKVVERTIDPKHLVPSHHDVLLSEGWTRECGAAATVVWRHAVSSNCPSILGGVAAGIQPLTNLTRLSQFDSKVNRNRDVF